MNSLYQPMVPIFFIPKYLDQSLSRNNKKVFFSLNIVELNQKLIYVIAMNN